MNIYEDYNKYIIEHEDLLNTLKKSSSNVLICFSDVIEVLDYVYKKYLDNVKIDSDLEEIFEIGFGYVSNILTDIKTYYEEYFNKDLILFNKYSTLIIYSVLLEDLKGYLLSEELLTKERKTRLDNAIELIDNIMVNIKSIDDNLLHQIEEDYEESLPKKHHYKPVYAVFMMIRDELGIF